MKRAINRGLLIALLLMACSLVFTVSLAEQSGTEGGISWVIDDQGVLTITGTGHMPNTVDAWLQYSDLIEKVVIEEGITNICGNAFRECVQLTEVSIPDTITIIGDSAFQDCESLKAISIPDSVTSIGDSAFMGCGGLKNVEIPEGIIDVGSNILKGCDSIETLYLGSDIGLTCRGNTSLKTVVLGHGFTVIPSNMFNGCTTLTNVTIPVGVTAIKASAFYNCPSLKSIVIPRTVTTIGSAAFAECDSLRRVNIPAGVVTVNQSTFSGCRSLSSVTIPNTVASIESSAFYYCESLERITVPDSVTRIRKKAFGNCISLTDVTIPDGVTDIGDDIFYGDENIKHLYLGSDIGLSLQGNTSLETVIIGSGVTAIPANMFSNSSGLTNVEILDGVTSIGASAFSGCTSLSKVSIANSVAEIGTSAFMDCYSLRYVDLPAGLAVISTSLFQNCTGLTGVYVPAGVTTIRSNAFYNCYSMTKIAIPQTVTSIGSAAFAECAGLTSVTIPSGVTTINQSTFSGCRLLVSVDIPDTVISIESSAFYYCVNLKSVVIPDSVTRLRRRAFGYCTSLTDVTIPDNVTDIGEDIFYNVDSIENLYLGSDIGMDLEGYESLQTVTIGGGITIIPDRMFLNCRNLTSAQIGESVTSMGVDAFTNCGALTDLVILDPDAEFPWDTSEAICANCSEDLTIYGWSGSTAEEYANLFSITFKAMGDQAANSGWCGENVRWSYDPYSHVLTISGTGEMADYRHPFIVVMRDEDVWLDPPDTEYNYTPWYDLRVQSVVIESGVTSIGNWAFNKYSISSIVIPDTVISIGEHAFESCDLRSVDIPESVASIGEYAFFNCLDLFTITIRNPELDLENASFGSYKYSYDNLGFDITDLVFWGWDDSTTETFANDHRSTFKSLGTYYVSSGQCGDDLQWAYDKSSDTLTIWGNGDMWDFEKVLYYYTREGIEYIEPENGEYFLPPWHGCSFSKVIIKEGVTSIGECAFTNHYVLGDVVIPEGVTSIGDSAFEGCHRLKGIAIPSSVTTIGSLAFRECESIESMVIPSGVSYIGYYAFYECCDLTSVTIENPDAEIDPVAGFGLYDNQTRDFPLSSDRLAIRGWHDSTARDFARNWDIAFDSFDYPMSTPDLMLPAYLTAVEPEAFAGISASVVFIPDGVTSLGSMAFADCAFLTEIRIPASVEVIPEDLFEGADTSCLTIFGTHDTAAFRFAIKMGLDFEVE